MATSVLDILVKVSDTQLTKLERDLAKTGSTAEDAGKRFGKAGGFVEKFGTAAKVAGVAGLGALFGIAKVGFDDLLEGQKVMAQTEAVIKSTGGAAGLTADDVANLASEITNYSGVSDEAIQAGENVLLTFTNVRNEVGKGNDIFSQATKIAVDMSVALGTDLKGANIQLGKALNDPIKGVSALSRVGVSFTAQQKAQIKALVDSGKTMEAQKIILAELGKEFGGSAKAAGETFSGQLAIAKENLSNTAGTIVASVLPALMTFSNILATGSRFLAEHTTLAKVLFLALGVGASVLLAIGFASKVYAAGQAIVTGATAAWTAAQWLLNAALSANPIGLIILALAALVGALILAYRNSETFREIVSRALAIVKDAARFVADFFNNNLVPAFKVAKDVAVQLGSWIRDNLVPIFQKLWDIASKLVTFYITAYVAAFKTAIEIVKTLFGAVKDLWTMFKSLFEIAQTIVGFLVGKFADTLEAFKKVTTGVARAIETGINVALDFLRETIQSIREGLKWIGDKGLDVFRKLKDAATGPLNALKELLQPVADFIGSIASGLRTIIELGNKIGGIVKAAGGLIGRRAAGGPIDPGKVYLVGENGPELFVSNSAGTIIPNNQLGSSAANVIGGATYITVNVEGSVLTEQELIDAIHFGLLRKQQVAPLQFRMA
jgi:hypothetical protein